ncbi:MAG TPA: pilin [Candidatus Paceibacterota bacterium]|nr:pilin [Candidatus Paceibacterota bacterium]
MKYLPAFLAFLLIVVPVLGFAQFGTGFVDSNNPNPAFDDDNPNPAFDDSNPNPAAQNRSGGSASIQNPLGDLTLTQFFLQIIEILLIFAVPIIVFFIILSGFKMVTAQGDTNQLTESKRAFIYAIIGGLLILGAFVILDVIQGTVNSFIQ